MTLLTSLKFLTFWLLPGDEKHYKRGPEIIQKTSKKRSGGSPGPPRDPPGDPGVPRGDRTRKNRFADTLGRPRFGHLFRPWTHLGALWCDFMRIFEVPAPRAGF